MSQSGWIGVDLDGTLAHYAGWQGADNIGAPIEPMVNRVKEWLAAGKVVKIFTARVAYDENGIIAGQIMDWCEKHIGQAIPVTNQKDYGMIELWDDRCVQVIMNTGQRADGEK